MTEHPRIDQFNDPSHFRDGDLPENNGPILTAYVPFGLRTTKITDIQSRTDLIRELTKQIPENEFGLPTYYYRPDMIDKDMILLSMERREATSVDEMLQNAICHVSYTQGFPTLLSNTPIWGQLPWESKEAYDGFTAYLCLDGIRSMDRVDHLALDLISEFFHLNYWFSRAKSYDLYRSAHHSRLREQRIMSLNDNHWTLGEQITKKLLLAIEGKTNEDLEKMDVDKLIASLERVTRIQRGSVGLSSGGKGSDPAEHKVTSVEIAMRNVSSNETKVIQNDEFDASLLEDPDVLMKAQELIVRVTR